MKQYHAIILAVLVALFLGAQPGAAFPGHRIFERTAHFAHKVGSKVDRHLVHPVTHGIARRLR